MGSIFNLELMTDNTKSTKIVLMLKLSYTKSDIGILKTGFLAPLTRMGMPS